MNDIIPLLIAAASCFLFFKIGKATIKFLIVSLLIMGFLYFYSNAYAWGTSSKKQSNSQSVLFKNFDGDFFIYKKNMVSFGQLRDDGALVLYNNDGKMLDIIPFYNKEDLNAAIKVIFGGYNKIKNEPIK
jgi:hypothetical protein